MTLQEWINREGGQRKCAKLYNFPPATLGAWYRLERFPRPATQQKLNKLAGGKIDFRRLMKDYMRELDKKSSAKKIFNSSRPPVPAGDIYRDFFSRNNMVFIQPDWQARIIFSSWDGIRLSLRSLKQAVSALPRQEHGVVDLFMLNDRLVQLGGNEPAAHTDSHQFL